MEDGSTPNGNVCLRQLLTALLASSYVLVNVESRKLERPPQDLVKMYDKYSAGDMDRSVKYIACDYLELHCIALHCEDQD